MISTILLVIAFVLALIEAFIGFMGLPPAAAHRPQLGWLALAFYFLSIILGGVR